MRRFPPPWTVEKIPGGLKVIDADGQSLAYVYSRENDSDARMAKVLTEDEARRIARAIRALRSKRSMRAIASCHSSLVSPTRPMSITTLSHTNISLRVCSNTEQPGLPCVSFFNSSVSYSISIPSAFSMAQPSEKFTNESFGKGWSRVSFSCGGNSSSAQRRTHARMV
jgi:hypothetical protein